MGNDVISWLDDATEPSTPEAALVFNKLADAALSQEGRDTLTTLVGSIEGAHYADS